MATPRTAAPRHHRHTVIDSPCGPLTLAASGDQLTGVYMETTRHPPASESLGTQESPESGLFRKASSQLAEYFAGQRTEFDLPLELHGTEFQRTVWQALLQIPYGTTLSYGELAQRIGRPTASRAVGLANGRNPISIVVPCHRVIGASGSLTGYGGGLDRKQRLLALEDQAATLPLAFPV